MRYLLLSLLLPCLLSVSGWAQTIMGDLGYTKPCPDGYKLCLDSACSGRCYPDPKYWETVLVFDYAAYESHDSLIRIDSMWLCKIDSIADTVPSGFRWTTLPEPKRLADTLPQYITLPVRMEYIDSVLVQIFDIRYRVDTTFLPKE